MRSIRSICLKWCVILVALSLLIGGWLVACLGPAELAHGIRARGEQQARARLVMQADLPDLIGFQRADGLRPLSFPADHGPHNDFQTEWWYYTGNLKTSDGRHFGYQLTFFRRALLPPQRIVARASAWGTSQAYMAHFALSDVAGERHLAFERLSRGAASLAGAQSSPFQVWLEDWRVEEIEEGVYRLLVAQEGIELDLTLVDNKGLVLQGDQGFSRKGAEPGQASYYYSLTRLDSSGTLRIGDRDYEVSGLSWMDHEFSTSALAADQVGWDWFSIQLDDGSELMLYQIRKEDGSADLFSSGALVAPDGSTRQLSREDYEIKVQGTWESPRTGALYPARWQVSIPAVDMVLHIEPLLADQELSVSYTYWEGCVRIQGSRTGQPLPGYGYVELTGYAGSMAGEF